MPDSQPLEPTADPISFEHALLALEQIVHDLEDGRLGLAESLARYEEGVKLLKQCHQLLDQAERRIEVLTGLDAAGNPVTEVFDDRATLASGDERMPRSRRGGKSAKKATEPQPEAEPSSDTMDEPGSLF